MKTKKDSTKDLRVGKHKLIFTVPPDNWRDSFPIGNGVLGATVYQPEGCWEWVINQMDVVTSHHHYLCGSDPYDSPSQNKFAVEEIKRRALKIHQDPANPANQDYNNFFGDYDGPRRYAGTFDPICGRLRIFLDRDKSLAVVSTEQNLSLETACVRIEENYDRGKIACETFVSQDAKILLIKISRTGRSPSVSGIEIHPDVSYPGKLAVANGVGLVTGNTAESFSHVMAAKVIEGKGEFKVGKDKLELKIPHGVTDFVLAVTVATSLDNQNPAEAACRILNEFGQKDYGRIKASHIARWTEFWAKSEINIPDKFLEYLWYFSFYLLNSTSGLGAKNPQGASVYGLFYNNPTIWPNCWYEDVNIEEAFWSVYVGNHLELSNSFVAGVKARLPRARNSARLKYGAKGASYGDYFLFHCIGPWYCQYLWWHYRYSRDESFLRETAYPIMKEVLAFFEDILVREDDGTLSLFPSICPEQGPVTKNDTLGLAGIKYLLKAGIESTGILSVDSEKAKKWTGMLAALSGYATADSKYGKIMLDSQWASPDLYLAHSSVLMPIYPLREVTGETARNTLRYAEERQGVGTHNFVWLAGAAAALGMGDEAVRLLYENGLVHMLVPTGLIVENTERNFQACSVLFPPSYSPFLPETAGGVSAAINEMLIQSRPEYIAVFPAIPKKWPNVSFSKLLAEGAFEVSAEMREGKTVCVEIRSLAGGKCRLLNPWPDKGTVVYQEEDNKGTETQERIIEILTEKNRKYRLEPTEKTVKSLPAVSKPEPKIVQPLVYASPGKSRIFIGRSETSHFLEKIDRFLFNPRLGAFEIPRATKYKLDFGAGKRIKDYPAIVPRQFLFPNKYGGDFAPVRPDTLWQTNFRYGFGWKEKRKLFEVNRRGPDSLRRDFIYGKEEAEFQVFLTEGSYQAFIVSGDYKEPRGITHITFPDKHAWETGRKSALSGFSVEVISFDVSGNGPASFIFSSRRNSCWKINLFLINYVP
ncbi:MAG: glycoside hydrolase family 95-like protein [Candidatus Ratteibacteria bacterium]